MYRQEGEALELAQTFEQIRYVNMCTITLYNSHKQRTIADEMVCNFRCLEV